MLGMKIGMIPGMFLSPANSSLYSAMFAKPTC